METLEYLEFLANEVGLPPEEHKIFVALCEMYIDDNISEESLIEGLEDETILLSEKVSEVVKEINITKDAVESTLPVVTSPGNYSLSQPAETLLKTPSFTDRISTPQHSIAQNIAVRQTESGIKHAPVYSQDPYRESLE
jgi:hypothetical protein